MDFPVSVVLSTRNRSASLARTLASVIECDRRNTQLELVIVDNGSSDDTAQILAGFREKLSLIVLHQPKPGLANALNLALDELNNRHRQNRLVIRTDDDITVDQQWLQAMRSGAEKHGTQCFFGGALEARFEETTKLSEHLMNQWPELSSPLFCTHKGKEGELPPGGLPFGGNMAFYLDQARSRRFDPNFGVPHALGNETDFLMQLKKAAYKPRYVHTAIAHHHIRREQVRFSWMARRMELYGRSQARLTWKYSPERAGKEEQRSYRVVRRHYRRRWLSPLPTKENAARKLFYRYHMTRHDEFCRLRKE